MTDRSKKTTETRALRLKKLRKEKGLSQRQFAKIVGIHSNAISEMERGLEHGGRSITEETAEKINAAFPEIRIAWLLGYDDYETEELRIHAISEAIQNRSDLIEQVIESHHYHISEYHSPEISTDEDGIEYHAILIEIQSPNGYKRYMRPDEFVEFKKNIHDIIEGLLLLKYKMPKDGANEYWSL